MTKILKHCSLLWIVLWCLGTGTDVAAQIVLTPTAGCAPLTVQFSGPAGATAVHWNLGTGVSNLASPSNLYSNPGNYQITYTAIVNGSPVSYNALLKVSAPPTASFSHTLPSSGCSPVTVQFSGSGGAAGSTYQWAFGDLTALGTGKSVNHTYNAAGSYTPVMIVTDAVTGCTAVAQSQAVVHVSNPANILITGNPGLSACNNSLTTAISGSLSTSGSPIGGGFSSVTWTFTSGTPSSGNGINPGSVTFMQGVHLVLVSVTDNNKCKTIGSTYVSVTQPSLSTIAFATVDCIGEKIKWNYSSTESLVYITEPGGTTYQVPQNPPLPKFPPITLNNPGINVYTVSAYPPFPCASLTKTFEVFAEVVTVNYATNSFSTCQNSFAATYTATGSSNYTTALTYSWSSGSIGYNVSNPNSYPLSPTGTVATFTFSQGSNNPYTIFEPWKPAPTVYMRSSTNCFTTFSDPNFYTIQRPTAYFYTSQISGCSPLQVKFQDTSRTNSMFPLAGYTLYSGVGTTSVTATTTSIFPVTFTYSPPGTYSAYLVVETGNGCRDTSFYQEIKSVAPPSVTMDLVPSTSVCAGQTVQVNLHSSPSNSLIQHWHVTADQGLFYGCVSDTVHVSQFNHIGTQGFTLHAYQDGCEGTAVALETVLVKGPKGTVRSKRSCMPGQKLYTEFFVELQDVDNALLDFGDNTSENMIGNLNGVTSLTFAHTYTASGDYTVVLYSQNSNSGCGEDTFSLVVKARNLDGRISHNNILLNPSDTFALGCEGIRLELNSDLSQDAALFCGRRALWMLSSPTFTFPVKDTAAHAFLNDTLVAGVIYKMILRTKDDNECTDFDSVYFRLSKATPNFSFSSNPICLSSGTVQLINNSQSLQKFGDQITASQWIFGEGSLPYIPTNPLENPVKTYLFATPPFQHFTVALTVTNNIGCVGTYTTVFQVNNPYPGLQSSAVYPCVPKNSAVPVTLSGISGYATYSFNPGVPGINPTTTSQNTVNVPYYVPGTFVASLTVTDLAGCKASESLTVQAIGQATPHIVMPNDVDRFCLPAAPTLIADIDLNQTVFTNTLWTTNSITTPAPGTGTFNNYIFTTPGAHTIDLVVNYNGYCSAKTSTVIIVADPHATLAVNRSRICLGDTLKVSLIDSSSVQGWQWFFGDFVPQPEIYSGSVPALLSPTLSYPYNILPFDSAGRTEVALRYFGSMGACPRTATASLQVVKVNTGFSENSGVYEHCLGRQDQFTAFTKNNWGLQFTYSWDLGDKSTATGPGVSHTFTKPGTYDIYVEVRDTELGCRDTAHRRMRVFPLPTVTLSANSDLICPGDTVYLLGSGNPGAGGTLTGTLSPAASFSFSAQNEFTLPVVAVTSTTFQLVATDENQCESKPDTASVHVMPKPLPTKWDTSVIIGQTVSLYADAKSNFTYTWTPYVEDLSCTGCPSPVSSTTINATYSVLVTDQPMGCFTTEHLFRIIVIPKVSLDVPTAFTPNGDGVNDVIYPDGWGLHRLLYFRIYNRWGQLIFETADLKLGWDGRFNGEPQNMETYVYQVAAETLTNEVLTKSGSFKLLR